MQNHQYDHKRLLTTKHNKKVIEHTYYLKKN